MIYYVPLERLEQRYTNQMYKWILNEASTRGIELSVIWGEPLRNNVGAGQFLDWPSRCNYCAIQNTKIARLFDTGQVKNEDVFFVADIWHPGLEQIAYMAQLSGIRVRIYAIQHAGVFDKNDLVRGLLSWGGYQEAAWYRMCSNVFVGSEYLKQSILIGMQSMGLEPADNLVVTGQIWDGEDVSQELSYYEKDTTKQYVIWPHRISPEKNIGDLYKVAQAFKNEPVKFLITSSNLDMKYQIQPKADNVEFKAVTKHEYYCLLKNARLMLSTAYQETYGYTIREATVLNTPILCPTRACYPEYILSESNLYSTIDEAIEKVKLAIAGTLPIATIKPSGGQALMFDIMTGEDLS